MVKKAFLFLFSVLCLSLFSASTYALDIEQKDLMIIDQSSTITIYDAGIGEFRIAPNIEFNKLNDYITYKLTLKNLDGKNYKVVSVKDTNSNSQIKTVYNYPSEMNPEDKDILISLVYGELDTNKTPLKSFTATISLIDDENNTEDITIEGDVTAPDTGRNLGTTNAKPNTVLSIMIFILGVIIFYIIFCSFINRNRKIKEKVKIKNTVGVILAFLLIPGAIAIAASSKDITFEINFNQASINGPYKVTFNTDGGTAIAPQIIEKGDKASRPANPTKNGYMFQKWIDEEGNDFDFDTAITTDRNIKAIYNIETYSITYTLNGGTAANPTSYTVETNTFTLNNPEKAGYNFIGWTGSNGTTPQMTVTITNGTIGDLSYTANWIPIATTYTVIYDANTGTGDMPNQIIDSGNAINLATNTFTAPKPWQSFISWNTVADGSGEEYMDGQSVIDLAMAGQEITLYAQWGCGINNICYSDNGANSPTTMDSQTVADSDSKVLLWASNFQRSGYGFAGWNTEADGTGVNYGPNETITDAGVIAYIKSNGLILYAKWIRGAGDLQGWTGCDAMSIGDITALTDLRDGDTYAVAKLADGKCWMIENLRLDNTAEHNSDGFLARGYASDFVGLAAPEVPWSSNSHEANSLYSIDGTTAVTVSGPNPAWRIPRYNNDNTANSTPHMTTRGHNLNIYSFGNYYTWSAAVADTSEVNYYGDHNATSICPTGWRLPTSGHGVTDFGTLNPKVGSEEEKSSLMLAYPNNFVYSGYVDYGEICARGTEGMYTSSVTSWSMEGTVWSLNINAARTTHLFAASRDRGLSIRCIADN